MLEDKDRGPGVKIPPPLIFAFYILIAYLIHRSWPVHLPEGILSSSLDVALFGIGVCIASVSAYQFWKAKTHIEPWQPASFLICTGIFAYSRNPIYLSFIFVTTGVGFWLESLWVIVSNIPATLTLYRLVIIKEEGYLERRFGEEYKQYKSKVRRWI